MSATLPAGADTPCLPHTPSGRKRPVSIPWREVACRLAEGARPAAVAADMGFPEERIWRHLRKSLRFRFYLQQAMERQRLLAGLQLATLGQTALLSRGLKPDSLDGDLLRLLSEAAHHQEPAGNLSQQIEQLGKTGEPPPNMAFRRRLAEEKRGMDLQVELWRVQDAARAATAAEPQRAETNRSEPPRSETNTREAERTETSANEPERSETNANEAQRTPHLRPAAPPAEPSLYPVVDLDGPDLRRLRANGQLGHGRGPFLPDS